MIGVIDYNAGNLTSVCNTLEKISGVKFFVSSSPEELEKAEKIIFPGVGHAQDAMRELQSRGLDMFIKNTKKPVLGICVGMQLLFDFSQEGNVECLGIIPGEVQKFSLDTVPLVPHMGWNEVSQIAQNHPIFSEISDYSDFYFVHSYFCFPTDPIDVLAMTDYESQSFCCAVQRENFVGVQFHPEKSSQLGQKILENFCR